MAACFFSFTFHLEPKIGVGPRLITLRSASGLPPLCESKINNNAHDENVHLKFIASCNHVSSQEAQPLFHASAENLLPVPMNLDPTAEAPLAPSSAASGLHNITGVSGLGSGVQPSQ